MAHKNESRLTRELCKKLEKLGVQPFAVVGGQRQAPGWPDRFFAAKGLPGGCAWVEFKQPKGKLSPAQKHVGTRLRKRGVLAVVYYFSGVFRDFDGNDLQLADHLNPEAWLEALIRAHTLH